MRTTALIASAVIALSSAANANVTESSTAATNRVTATQGRPLRDPFTPIGYTPKATEPTTVVEAPTVPNTQTAITWPELKVLAILLSEKGDRVASIAGVGAVHQGQIIAKDVRGVRYTWRIDKITKTTIVPVRLDAKRLR